MRISLGQVRRFMLQSRLWAYDMIGGIGNFPYITIDTQY